ncbi:MAG: hypothetical protein WKF88_09480 [Ferruginibacter sp.]
MSFWKRNKNENGLRTIKTARDEESINLAAINGFMPLLKKVELSDKIRSKYAVFQNKKTGEIEVGYDFRGYDRDGNSDYEVVIDWTFYYPHCFKSPFAAYLIPRDIMTGEKVFLEDLIEDLIGADWNQGDTFRLESCEAVWTGKTLEIQYDPAKDRSSLIG